jgi:hypothetical protein
MNLHNKMKNLENKYLDLANFYKKELVTQSRNTGESNLPFARAGQNTSASDRQSHRLSQL